MRCVATACRGRGRYMHRYWPFFEVIIASDSDVVPFLPNGIDWFAVDGVVQVEAPLSTTQQHKGGKEVTFN